MPLNARRIGWLGGRLGCVSDHWRDFSALKIAKAREPGLYEDGGGLRLIITDKGTKRWAIRITVKGRRVEKGLGIYPEVSLEAARRRASELRQAAKVGIDLHQEEKTVRLKARVTFRTGFEQFFAVRRQRLSNGKHVQQWENTMRDYVLPAIGDLPIADIGAADLLDVVTPIWFEKPETASRVLQRLKATFDSAILRGFREKANPCTGIAAELGTSHRKVKHHLALPWKEVPAFFASLDGREMQQSSRLLFRFLILTACRSGEARGATWKEVNFNERTWSIPADRMKAGLEHIAPLAEGAVHVLACAKSAQDTGLIFPGRAGQALSDNTLSKAMRDWGVKGTPHGFRSAFKDWAAESGVRDEVSEVALAHVDRNKVRAAYRRTDFLEERRQVMESWSQFVTG